MSLYDAGAAQSMVVGACVENLHAGAFWLKTGRQKSGFVGRSNAGGLTMARCAASLSADLLESRDSQKPRQTECCANQQRWPAQGPDEDGSWKGGRRSREPLWEGGQQNRWSDVRFYEGHSTAQRSTAESQQNHFVFCLGVVLLLVTFRYHVVRGGVGAGPLQG
ncbi:hypothetical protein BGZ57DRAFT_182298 [Hyaloscypha finlandica]|nr:hypothetical protein BGZ57DRAFT_182298 [Hyaloscypha finlandica]